MGIEVIIPIMAIQTAAPAPILPTKPPKQNQTHKT